MSAIEVTLKLYKSSLQSCQYILKSGRYVYFKDGRHATDDSEVIAELDEAIKLKHPHIFVSAGEAEITAKKYGDPLAEIKEKAIAEYLAEQSKKKDFGNSDQKPSGMGTTESLANLKESNSKK